MNRLRLVTWNVHGCVGTDGVHDPRRIADVLATIDADVIGLQEVDWRHPPTRGLDPLAFIAAQLGMHAVAGSNLRDHRGEYGNGLLTRLDVERVEHIRLAHAGREPRGAIDARLRRDGFHVRAVVTHLGLRRGERRVQVDRIRAALAGDDAPATVLLGDLNEWRPGPIVGASLVPDPFPVGTCHRTWPSRRPWFRLDRVLLRPRPAELHARTVRSAEARRASDHLPVVVDAAWGSARS